MTVTCDKVRLYYILGCAVAGVLFASYFLRHTLSATLTSLALAYLANPLLKRLERRGFSRSLAITLMYGMLAVVLLYASFFFLPYLGHQANALATSLPRYVQSLRDVINSRKGELVPYFRPEDLAWLTGQVNDSLDRLATDASNIGIQQFKGVVFALFDLCLAPVLVFFMLFYKEYFKDILLDLTPPAVRAELKALGHRINRTLERFLVSMLLDCLLVGILCAIALWLLGIEFPLLNGLFAGFATVVPFIGATVSVIPPAFIGYAQTGDLAIIPKVCAVYFLINVVVEGNIIKPLVMRGTLKLNPLAVIFSVMALGEIMGFWGIVLAIPCAAVAKLCAAELREIVGKGGACADRDV